MSQGELGSVLRLAVLLPSLNEETAIEAVIDEVRRELPEAKIFVFDNNSDDKTVEIAKSLGATVFIEKSRGKGNVVRRMFADVEADIYLMIDADATYDLSSARALIKLVAEEKQDMVVGTRMQHYGASGSRMGHEFGNRMITKTLNAFFGVALGDVLSGYRVFSRRFVKTAPILAKGFEVETVLTVHALEAKVNVCEVPINYRERAEGSESKLNTFRDGLRIITTIFFLIKNVRPFLFFSCLACVFVLVGLIVGVPVIDEYFVTGLVPRFPTAILATGLIVLGAVSAVAGLILDAVAAERRSAKRLAYLSCPALDALSRYD
jgi:glycosyltransferase involved in cell wall biosynthesis